MVVERCLAGLMAARRVVSLPAHPNCMAVDNCGFHHFGILLKCKNHLRSDGNEYNFGLSNILWKSKQFQ